MNKLGFIILGFASAIVAAPVEEDMPVKPVKILSSYQNGPDLKGFFSYGFKSANGIEVQAEGNQEPPENNGEDSSQIIRGSFSYPNENGELIKTSYTAGKDGYIATGDHIHPPPPHVAALIKHNNEHPEENDYFRENDYPNP